MHVRYQDCPTNRAIVIVQLSVLFVRLIFRGQRNPLMDTRAFEISGKISFGNNIF